MSVDELEQRFTTMLQRLAEVYDGIGHSTGRPYLYFVYPPDKDQALRRWADEQMTDSDSLCYLHIDLVQITIERRRRQIDCAALGAAVGEADRRVPGAPQHVGASRRRLAGHGGALSIRQPDPSDGSDC